MGCQHFDPEVNISGIILNRVAGQRQKNLIKSSIEKYCKIPVIGAIPKLKDNPFPERHMGLVPHFESNYANDAVNWARKPYRYRIYRENRRQRRHSYLFRIKGRRHNRDQLPVMQDRHYKGQGILVLLSGEY